jgi:AcrR family transcriptional regulator
MTDAHGRTPATRGRGRPPKDSGEDVREAILDAASDLFAERGYAATPVNAVCERAGVGKPAVYWHFENKQGLLAAVLERLDKHWSEVRVADAPAAGPTDALDRMIEVWRRRVLESPNELLLPMALQLEPLTEESSQVISTLWRRAEERFAQGVREAVGRDLPDLDLVGHTAITLMQGAMHRYNVDRDVAQLDRLLADFRNTILLVIGARVAA